jgi:hypothetical protein
MHKVVDSDGAQLSMTFGHEVTKRSGVRYQLYGHITYLGAMVCGRHQSEYC